MAHAARQTDVEQEVRQAIESRLIALSRSHDLLTSERWEAASLRDVVAQALEPFAGRDSGSARFSLEGDKVRLRPKPALALGLAVHELATNAAKYGALSNDAGSIAVAWRIDGERLRLRWEERDGPPVEPPLRKGFGSRLIERGLEYELDGTVRLDFAPAGVICEIEMPAPTKP